jgi:hypothetical protein
VHLAELSNNNIIGRKTPTGNRLLAKERVQCLNKVLCIVPILVVAQLIIDELVHPTEILHYLCVIYKHEEPCEDDKK